MSTGLGPHLQLQQLGVFLHWCPACNRPHEIHMRGSAQQQRIRWDWNDNTKRPTFWPALLVERADGAVCHYQIVDGHIQFEVDSTHDLAGTLVPMPIYPT